MAIQLDLRPPAFRDRYYGTAWDSTIVRDFLNNHRDPRRFLRDVLDSTLRPAGGDRVYEKQPWGARDTHTKIELHGGDYIVQWNHALNTAAVSEVVR